MNQHEHGPASPAGPRGSDGEHEIQRQLDTTDRAARFYDEQVTDRLNPRMRDFVVRQEMFFLATADARGECDSTFRAGPPGFLLVLDDRTLAYPEYRGNGVMASLGNIRENPHVGILMIDFSRDRVGLHVNGRARLVSDELMRIWRTDLPVDPAPGRRPQMWVEIDIEEAYIHCAKHIPHLVRPPSRDDADGEQAWGTDDVRRKGGDFFGAAAESHAAGVVPRRPPRRVPRQKEPAFRQSWAAGPLPADLGERARLAVRSRADRAGLPDPDMWRREAERALARATAGERREPDATAVPAAGGAEAFRGWFG